MVVDRDVVELIAADADRRLLKPERLLFAGAYMFDLNLDSHGVPGQNRYHSAILGSP